MDSIERLAVDVLEFAMFEEQSNHSQHQGSGYEMSAELEALVNRARALGLLKPDAAG